MSNTGSGTAKDTTGCLFGCSKQLRSGWRPSFKRKLELVSVACDCSPSKKKREMASDFVQKYSGAITDQGDVHRKLKPETHSFELIGHARWAFANSFDVVALMDLASSQLAHKLAEWSFQPLTFTSQFGDLVRYTYSTFSERVCQLTQIIAQYAACVAEEVSGLEGRPALLKNVPNFAVDLVGQMIGRVG